MRVIGVARAAALVLIVLAAAGSATAAPPADLDAYVDQVMKRFGPPGMAVAIVEVDKTVHAKGYGLRELGKPARADEHTVFPIGSETKAFTAAALAILVDQGKVKWDEPVVKYLPEFRMYDPYATQHMTVRDLLTHRSGLGLGQGDLLIIPATNRSRADVVQALRYLKPRTGFRETYAYDNILYIVAGELVRAVSGRPWEDFVRANILKPAGMSDATTIESTENPNHVALHARTDGPIRGVGAIRVLERGLDPHVAAAAGAINASATDMARWMTVLLGGGKTAKDTQVFSQQALDELWKPVVVVPEAGFPIPELQATVDTYALGWFVRDYRGHKIVTHSGGVLGGVAAIVIIPEKNVGISVAINSEDSLARWSVFYHLLDGYLGLEPLDWPTKFEKARADLVAKGLEALKQQPEQVAANVKLSLPVTAYAGVYRDAWYGTMTIAARDDGLRIRFDRTPGMEGSLEPAGADTFRTRWTDRSIENAYVKFAVSGGRIVKVTMNAISPLADFSFDYQDLEFVPDKRGG